MGTPINRDALALRRKRIAAYQASGYSDVEIAGFLGVTLRSVQRQTPTAPDQPCANCGELVKSRRGQVPGGDWWCPTEGCLAACREAKRVRILDRRKDARRGKPERVVYPDEWWMITPWPVDREASAKLAQELLAASASLVWVVSDSLSIAVDESVSDGTF